MSRDGGWDGTYDWGNRKYDDRTLKLLYGLSGNRCADPDCNNRIIADATAQDEPANLGEIAHIYSAKSSGPRAFTAYNPPQEFINGFSNLILFCGYCHTRVDKQEKTFTVEELKAWKANHLAKNLLTKQSHLPPDFRERSIIGAKFTFQAVDAMVLSVEPPQLRQHGTGQHAVAYHRTRVWFERQDGSTFTIDFVNDVPCTTQDRVSFLSVFAEGDAGFDGRLYNHRSSSWTKLAMPQLGWLHSFGESSYITKREYLVVQTATLILGLCTLLAVILAYQGFDLLFMLLFAITYSCNLLLQSMRRKALAKSLDDIQRDIDIS